jgi:LPPG:FO 2-phospho-L-lactate transferase
MKVVALAGGVGGAKLADGLAMALPPQDLTVIVNIGDDFELLGLNISPDLDTVCYTLAGLANPETGWGRMDETWHAFESLQALGAPTWFHIGDRDLGTHLERTRRLRLGTPLSQVTRDFCQSWGVACRVIPASDDPVPTIVSTDQGRLPFQSYFVERGCQPVVMGFDFTNVLKSTPAPGVLEALQEAGVIVFCPSNPWVSIDPILAIPGIREAVSARPAVAVSPIIGGQAVKGPAAKMYSELGIQPSALAVARHYGPRASDGLLSGFVLDRQDQNLESEINALGMKTLVTGTLMKTGQDRVRLASELLQFIQQEFIPA